MVQPHPFGRKRKRNAEIVAIATQKTGRFWRYNLDYIGALYGITGSAVCTILSEGWCGAWRR